MATKQFVIATAILCSFTAQAADSKYLDYSAISRSASMMLSRV